MMDEMGLIHMNGRVYDPYIGRFMSADPYIQSPDHLGSYNRYSYVWNNPLSATDPSGYFLKRLWKNIWREVKKVAPIIIGVVSTIACGGNPVCGAWATGIANGLWAKSQGASWKDAFRIGAQAGLTSYFMNLAGDVGQSAGEFGAAHYAAHAAAGCAGAMVGGGNCGQGAVSGLLGLAGTDIGIALNAGKIGQFVASTISGGLGSMAAGGSFMDGAQTAAFGYLFNCVAHQCWKQAATGVLKTVGGVAAVKVGATICATTGVWCIAGVPMMIAGASDATQGVTMTYDAYVGLTSEGWNPIKDAFYKKFGNAGAAGYEYLSATVSLTSFAAKVPLTGSMFGVNVSRWNNPNQFLNLQQTRGMLFFGVGSKVWNGTQDLQK